MLHLCVHSSIMEALRCNWSDWRLDKTFYIDLLLCVSNCPHAVAGEEKCIHSNCYHAGVSICSHMYPCMHFLTT